MNNPSKGFTLLELLTVMALISILSFSVIYSLQNRPQQPLKQSQKLIEKLIQTARTTAILKNRECRLLLCNEPISTDHERLFTIMIKENSGQWKNTITFVELPEGVQANFDKCETMLLESKFDNRNELWAFISFSPLGLCDNNTLYLKAIEDNSIKMAFIMSATGGIEINE